MLTYHKRWQRDERLNKKNPSSPSLNGDIELNETRSLLDFDKVNDAFKQQQFEILTYQSDDSDHEQVLRHKKTKTEKERKRKKETQFQPHPKLHVLVGFLRATNFVCAVAVIFGVIVSLNVINEDFAFDSAEFWIAAFQISAGYIHLLYLAVVAAVMVIDSVGTITFRWKEYGEITHNQADATSVLFLFVKSRWGWRLASSLAMASSISLGFLNYMRRLQQDPLMPYLDHAHFWFIALSSASFGTCLLGLVFNVVPNHGIGWLYDSVVPKHIEDKGDIWIKTWAKDDRKTTPGKATFTQAVLNFFVNLTTLLNYLVSSGFNFYGMFLLHHDDFESFVILAAFISLQLLNTGVLIQASLRLSTQICLAKLPFSSRFFGPFVLTCSLRLLNDLKSAPTNMQVTFSAVWLHLCVCTLVLALLNILINQWPWWDRLQSAFKFVVKNCKEDGVSKKTIRFLDTLASLCALIGLILGIVSLFLDLYDVTFTPQGTLKKVTDAVRTANATMEPLTNEMRKIIKAIDLKFTCHDVYTVLGTGSAASLFASFFPGAPQIVQAGSRSAYYGVRAKHSLTNLATKLKKASGTIWGVMRVLLKTNMFAIKHFKKIVLASNSGDILRLMPLLPPVVIGLYVFFGVFWPRRQLFFSAKQRRAAIASTMYRWILAIIILIVAVVINTALVDEMVRLLDENIGLAKVELERNIGWTLAMSGLAFCNGIISH